MAALFLSVKRIDWVREGLFWETASGFEEHEIQEADECATIRLEPDSESLPYALVESDH